MSRQIHPDADTLAAFFEHSLSTHERAGVFSHLAECPTCRAYLAASSRLTKPKLGRPLRAAFATAAMLSSVLLTGWLLFHSPRQDKAANYGVSPPALKKIELTHLSFAPESTARPAPNQIVLPTSRGDRWVTMPLVWQKLRPK